MKESFNYGLFCPPVNGKAGKFLDEERRLGDYPFNGPVGYLEVTTYSLNSVSFETDKTHMYNLVSFLSKKKRANGILFDICAQLINTHIEINVVILVINIQ